MGIKGVFHKIGQKVSAGFHKFGQQASRDLKSVGKFVRDKALPAVEKVAGQVGRGIAKYGVPIASAVAPELLPVVAGAAGIARGVAKAAGTGRSLIASGEKVVSAVKSGDVGRIKAAAMEGRGELRRAGVRV